MSDSILRRGLHRAPVRQPVGIDLAHRRRDAHRPGRVHRRFAARFELAPTRASAEELHEFQEIGSLATQGLPVLWILPHAFDESGTPFIVDDDRLIVERSLIE